MQISIALLLLFAGLLLAVWRSKSGEKNPLVTLAGLVILCVALVAYLFSGLGLVVLARSLFVDAGIALLGVGALLALRRQHSSPFFALGLGTLGLGLLLAFAVRTFADAPEAETTFLLELGPDDRIEEVEPLLARFDARAERAFPEITMEDDEDLAQYFLVYVRQKLRDELMALLGADTENVDTVEPNMPVDLDPVFEGEAAAAERGAILTDDPLAAQQWGLAAIGGHAVHALVRDVQPARKAVVAILDTGVDAAHEDLGGAFRRSPGTRDGNGHGTHCAGIAGALTNNGRGVASLNWEGRFVEIVSFQALPFNGAGSVETIAQAILDATQAGADVISMSLGEVAPVPPRVVDEAVRFALDRGVIVVASAGNASDDAARHMPSNIDGVIAVAAVDRDLKKARFSNTTTALRRPIAAPGVDILSLKPNGTYAPLSGTSMATPMVAGLLGLLRSLQPDLTADEAYALLHDTGMTVEDTPLVGRVIHAEAAVRALLQPGTASAATDAGRSTAR